MDIGLLFVLPLIGGFIFVSNFTPLKYSSSRAETQRLYYQAAFYGFLFSIAAGGLHFTLKEHYSPYTDFFSWIHDGYLRSLLEQPRPGGALLPEASSRIRADIVIICVWALIIGAATPIWNKCLDLINNVSMKFFNKGDLLFEYNLKTITDELELFIFQSGYLLSPIQVNLNNSKVYVGTIVETGLPEKTLSSFRMQLMMSGFRSSDDGTVCYNTFYNEVLERLTKDAGENNTFSFEMIIPIENIVTIGPFDLEAYDAFQSQETDYKKVKKDNPNNQNSKKIPIPIKTQISNWLNQQFKTISDYIRNNFPL